MVVTEETSEALTAVDCILRSLGRVPYLATLYCYYCTRNGETVLGKEVKEATGLALSSIAMSRFMLEELGFITINIKGNNKKIITTHDKYTSLNINTVSDLLNIYIGKHKKREELDDVHVQAGGFSESDIREDEDWKKAEPILLKYFKPYQINPKLLTYKKWFESLCNLLSDSTFDFDLYCRWYREHKYPQKKFGYGLFLFPSMITEFRDSIEELDDTYLRTSSRLEDSDSFKKGLKETEEFLKTLQDEES